MPPEAVLPELPEPALADTGVWTWVRDRRFPQLAAWFNGEVRAGRVLVCDLVVLELVRLAPNRARAQELENRLALFPSVPMAGELWTRARRTQLALATDGGHRAVPPADLMIAAAAETSDVLLLHYDADYQAIAEVSELRHRWLVSKGSLT